MKHLAYLLQLSVVKDSDRKTCREVYVGLGSRVSSDIIDFSSFKSPVTKTTEL